MTSLPLSRQTTYSPDPSEAPSPQDTPVFALKELVVRLHREQQKTQDLLSSLGFALRSFKNLNQFLELIPLIASRVTDADGGALVLFKPNGKVHLEQVHCHDLPHYQHIQQALETATHQVSLSLVTATPSAHQSASALDQTLVDCLGTEVQLFGTPVLVKQGERGRLYVFSWNGDYSWTENRQKLIRLIADQTAVAIENEELTLALRQKERLDRELEIGAEIQEQLLPHHCPVIEGVDLAYRWQPAGHVGGDYFDFIPANPNLIQMSRHGPDVEGCWSIIIGDVMGKGVPAGLIMTLLRGTLRAEVLNGHTPACILQHVNQLMYGDLERSSRFVTLFYSWYNPRTGVMAFSNAAHNPPLLWRAETQVIHRLDAFGMLIGLESTSHYQESQISLYPGDTLIYYTDGITEASNLKGDRFEEENLIFHFQQACVRFDRSQAILDYLFDQVRQFTGDNQTHEDDITLIVMRVQPDV